MTAKELRQAAERYRKHAQVSLYMKDMKGSPYTYIDVSTGAVGIVNEAWDNDAHRLANAYLATVQEDGEEKIDQKWLMECWGFRDDANWDSEDEDVESSLVDTGCYKCIEPEGMIIWCQETGLTLGRDGYTETIVQFPVSTRSQFRSLMKGLNIEPQKNIGKKIK